MYFELRIYLCLDREQDWEMYWTSLERGSVFLFCLSGRSSFFVW